MKAKVLNYGLSLLATGGVLFGALALAQGADV